MIQLIFIALTLCLPCESREWSCHVSGGYSALLAHVKQPKLPRIDWPAHM